MKKVIDILHLRVDIQGLLNHYHRKSMKGLMRNDDGRLMTDKEVRVELQRHLSLGHTILPMCDNSEDCPDFDYFGGGCPGHGVHYYDDNDNEISKEEYYSLLKNR